MIHEKGGDVLDCGGEHCGVEGDGGKELSREYKMQPWSLKDFDMTCSCTGLIS